MFSYLKKYLPANFNDFFYLFNFLPPIGIYKDMQPEILKMFMYQITDINCPEL